MLTVLGRNQAPNCAGVTRREFLQAGTLALGGLTLADVLRAQAVARESGTSFVRNKSVVLLFLSGGASHIETFDPKMSAPQEIRSITGEVATCIPGVTFGGTFAGLAQRADRMAVVRSFTHPLGGHEQAIVHVLTGGTDPAGRGEVGFSMGAMYARLRGTNHPVTGIPTYALLNSDEVDPQYRNERGRVQRGSHGGRLGTAYGPFEPSGRGPAVENMRLNIPLERLQSRRTLMQEIARVQRGAEASGMLAGLDRFAQQAFDLLTGGASEAFDLSREDPRVVQRYDTSDIRIGFKHFRPSDLGHLLLMARRLCESGCGFVTIHSAGWDMHADGNNPGIAVGMNMLGRSLDRAVSAFLDDLHQRGLSDDVLLVITGDFGRTPKINQRGGRDHWARLGTLALAGGGLPMGQVIGRSDRLAGMPESDPISPQNLMATLMHTLLDIGRLRLESGVPKDIVRLVETGEPIRELIA
jgi:hypothetical protein